MFDPEVLSALGRLREDGGCGVLVTVVAVSGSAPQRVGARLLLRADGSFAGTIGGGVVEARVLEDARGLLDGGAPRIERYRLTQELGMCCGGTMEVLMEALRAQPRFIIFGGGHVAKPTAQMAKSCGFEVVVVDERGEWASSERFPEMTVVNAPALDFMAEYAPRPDDHLFIVTRDHALDQDLLSRAVLCDIAWLGMIGSRRKVVRAMLRLEQEGVPKERRDRVRAPVGLDIGAESPAEIAVSVLAEVIQLRAQREARKGRRADAAPMRLEQPAEAS